MEKGDNQQVDLPSSSFRMTNDSFPFYWASVNRKLTPKLVVEVLNDPIKG